MNLALHHFCKEFRYLRLRWFAFLVLLALDLAVNLEWLFPLRADSPPRFWLYHMPFVVMLAGISLLSGCPEDRPGNDRSFIGTRPLALRSYWLARAGVWLGLMVLPLVLQNVIYLALSHRPWSDVWRGACERGWMVMWLTGCLLPLSALLRRGEGWWMTVSVAVVVTALSRALDVVAAKWFNTSFSHSETTAGIVAGLACFGLGTAWLAWRQQRQSIAPRRKLVWLCGLACAALLVAGWWPFQDPNNAPQDERLVQKIAPGLKVSFDLARFQFEGFDSDYSKWINAYTDIDTGHRDIHATLREKNSVVTQNGKRFGTDASTFGYPVRSTINSRPSEVTRGDAVLRDLFPAGTLFMNTGMMGQWRNDEESNLTTFTEPFPDPEQPLRIETDYAVDWFRRDRAIDLPLTAGGHGECDSDAWSILRVQEHTGRDGTQQGSVSVDIRWDHREHWDCRDSSVPILYSPERRLVWLMPLISERGLRGELTGWSRGAMRLTWQNVLNYADGEDAGVKVENLRLILLRSRYLGSSKWSWKSPDIRLADYTEHSQDKYHFSYSPIYKGREVKAYQERIATLKPPTASSAEPEVRRYLYDVLSAIHKTQSCYQKAAFSDITNTFRPLAENHLPQLLQLPSEMWPGWSNRPPITILDEYLKDEHRDMVIDLALTNSRMVDTVIRKGWAEQSKRLQPRILAMPQLPYGIEDLMLAWGDDASHDRLMQEQQRWPDESTMAELNKVPALRPRLEEIAREWFAKTVPMLRADNVWEAEHLGIATDFGTREALDVSLRWLALTGDWRSDRCYYPRPNLLDSDGSKFWKNDVDEAQQWPRYRHVKADDFDYLPEKRAWKLRTP